MAQVIGCKGVGDCLQHVLPGSLLLGFPLSLARIETSNPFLPLAAWISTGPSQGRSLQRFPALVGFLGDMRVRVSSKPMNSYLFSGGGGMAAKSSTSVVKEQFDLDAMMELGLTEDDL